MTPVCSGTQAEIALASYRQIATMDAAVPLRSAGPERARRETASSPKARLRKSLPPLDPLENIASSTPAARQNGQQGLAPAAEFERKVGPPQHPVRETPRNEDTRSKSRLRPPHSRVAGPSRIFRRSAFLKGPLRGVIVVRWRFKLPSADCGEQSRPSVRLTSAKAAPTRATAKIDAVPRGARAPRGAAAAALACMGVVFGDIGTSPLYTLNVAVKSASPDGQVSPEAVVGIVSLIFWSLIIVISIKYAILIMRADNHGEGGILALLALVKARGVPSCNKWRVTMVGIGPYAAPLLLGDGTITPAISVLSAIEGLKIYAPQMGRAVVPLTVAILVILFLIQRNGTSFIGGIFGPVMLIWFIVAGVLGVVGIVRTPAILTALSPLPAVTYFWHAGPLALVVIGGAFLAVTGGEAFYADMGHFGPIPIRIAWFGVALPALTLNYFGQGGLLLAEPNSPEAADSPFWRACPTMVALSACRSGDSRDRDRLAVDHFRRLFHDAAGDQSRLSAAHEGRSYRRSRDRPDLRLRQLGACRRHARGRHLIPPTGGGAGRRVRIAVSPLMVDHHAVGDLRGAALEATTR